VKTTEKTDFDIVAFGRRNLVVHSRVDHSSPRFKWVQDLEAFYNLLERPRVSAGVVALEEQETLAAFVRHFHPLLERKPLILIGTAERVGPAVTRLAGRALVSYLPAHVGERGVEETVDVIKLAGVLRSLEQRQHKGGLTDRASTRFLFDRESHRLHFKKVAKLFGLSERALAEIIDVWPSTADKTPDSKAIHEKLLPFERIARGLSELDDDQDAFRRWLNSPNAEFSNLTPLQVIERGKADVVADMVGSALLGQPA
jgi:Protein of unknown function (DUF2384)